MNGTLLLDLATIATAPRFFSLLALVERAAGRSVLVMSGVSLRKSADKTVQMFGIPITAPVHFIDYEDVPSAHRQKLALAEKLDGPVIWIDNDLGDWAGPSVKDNPNLVTLNWKAVNQGTAPIAERA